MSQKKTQTNQTLEPNSGGYRSGAGQRIMKGIEEDLKKFDLLKKQRAAKSIEDMKKIYITH